MADAIHETVVPDSTTGAPLASSAPPRTAPLRRGWTTGACAAAAAKAAYSAFCGLGHPDPVAIDLPRGGSAAFPLAEAGLDEGGATAAVTKDAGDDPDVTHGCLVRVRVEPGEAGQGLVFAAGEGVGTVTRPGLPIPPGEPAINPVPRQMIRASLEQVAAVGDLRVTVSIPGGEALAAKTLNPRLGIVGGLSVLGTTGVVVPFSCAAWIHSIHRGIDVARACGLEHLAAATGSTSEAALQRLYGLSDTALIDMGDFVGGTLKYLRRHPVPRLTLGGGFAKLSKLADGALDLHSSKGLADPTRLADWLGEAGAGAEVVGAARRANTALEVLRLATAAGLPLGEIVARRAQAVAQATVGGSVAVEVVVVDRSGVVVGRANPS